MTLYKSGEDYLKAILVLTNRNGAVRSLDVANYLNVTKPSVCRAMRLLREGEFLSMDENKRIHLTELGREVAEKVYERNRVLTNGLNCDRRRSRDRAAGCLQNRTRSQQGDI